MRLYVRRRRAPRNGDATAPGSLASKMRSADSRLGSREVQMKAIILGMTVLALAAIATAAGAAEPISEQEAQTLPPAVVVDRTFDLLGEVTTLSPNTQHLGPRLGYTLVTRPRPAGRFCRADWMRPEFDPPLALGADMERKGRVVGFSAGQVFAIADGRDCAALTPFDGFFSAPGDIDATWGYLLLERTIAEAGKGRLPVDCDPAFLPAGVKTCGEFLAGMKAGEVRGIDPCRERLEPRPAATCYVYSMRDVSLQIAAAAPGGGPVVHVAIQPLPVS